MNYLKKESNLGRYTYSSSRGYCKKSIGCEILSFLGGKDTSCCVRISDVPHEPNVCLVVARVRKHCDVYCIDSRTQVGRYGIAIKDPDLRKQVVDAALSGYYAEEEEINEQQFCSLI